MIDTVSGFVASPGEGAIDGWADSAVRGRGDRAGGAAAAAVVRPAAHVVSGTPARADSRRVARAPRHRTHAAV